MAAYFNFSSLVALLTLTILEVVLGVDNVIFLAVVTQEVPREQQNFVRRVGLSLALLGRIAMVLGVSYLLRLDHPLFRAFGRGFSAKDFVLIAGGIFLLYKATMEIIATTELREKESRVKPASSARLAGVIVQVMLIDMVFAIDSVLTAVGLTRQVGLIIIAMTIAILAMMFYAGILSDFIEAHPSVKVLALAFLVMIGMMLVADGFGQEVNRNYAYAAILFALAVEALDFRRQRNEERAQELPGPEE